MKRTLARDRLRFRGLDVQPGLRRVVPGWALAAALVLVVWNSGSIAQAPTGPVKGFHIPWIDKDTLQIKARVRGENALPMGPDRFDVTGLRAEFFSAGERTNFVVVAERCLVLVKERRLESPAPLRVLTADGQLALSGVGFSWEATQGLMISNRVDAALQRRGALEAGTPDRGTATPVAEPLSIRSEWFSYREGQAVFGRKVVVTEPTGELRCERLSFQMHVQPGELIPGAGDRALTERVERILAEESVEVTGAGYVARADRGDYELEGGLLELSGRARWVAGAREGEAEHVWIDRAAGRLRARDHVRVRMPAESFTAGVLPSGPSGGEPTGENPRMEIQSVELVAEPDADLGGGHRAIFRDSVRLVHAGGELQCARLVLRYEQGPDVVRGQASGDVRPIEAVAEGGVHVSRGMDWMKGTRAVYTATSGVARLDGPVHWMMEGREGRSDQLELDPQRRQTLAQGHVQMQLPPGSLRQLNPHPGADPGKASAGPGAEARDRESKADSTNAPVRLTADAFRYVGPEAGKQDQAGLAEWTGRVQVTQGDELEMLCDRLRAGLAGPDNRIETMEATGHVLVKAQDARGITRARGDRADYLAGTEEIRLTGDGGVEIEFEDEDGVHRGRGEIAVYDGRGSRLDLRGDARLDSTHGKLTGDLVRADRAQKRFSAQGLWRIRVPAESLKGDKLDRGSQRLPP